MQYTYFLVPGCPFGTLLKGTESPEDFSGTGAYLPSRLYECLELFPGIGKLSGVYNTYN